MIYSIVPLETIFEGLGQVLPCQELEFGGIRIQVESLNATEAKIVRLISSNPQDYLNPAYAPGQIIKFMPQTP